MNEEEIVKLCINCFAKRPKGIIRCAVGQANYVYIVEFSDRKIVVRCSEETGVYKDTIYLLERLAVRDIPVPRVLGRGTFGGYEYLILTYIKGKDIGLVYTELTAAEKREIARTVVGIQNKVSTLQLQDIPADWTWKAFAFYTLLFCADFMGERGMQFMDKQVPVSAEIVEQMNGVYEKLWREYVN